MIEKENIGQKLKELRLSRDLKQCEVAEKIGLSRATISNIEKGRRSLTLKTLKRFCELYSVDVSYFEIEVENYDESTDLTERLKVIFQNENISQEEKEKLYRTVMRLYLQYIDE